MECWPSFELNRLHVVASKRYVQFFVLRVTTIGSNMQWPRWNGLKRPLNRGLLSGAVSVLGGVHNYWSIQAIICRNLPPPRYYKVKAHLAMSSHFFFIFLLWPSYTLLVSAVLLYIFPGWLHIIFVWCVPRFWPAPHSWPDSLAHALQCARRLGWLQRPPLSGRTSERNFTRGFEDWYRAP